MTQPSGLSALRAPWQIGVDVGGTFTDLVLTDSAGEIRVIKVPSVPSAPSRGVLSALDRLALALDCGVGDILGDCALFVHGSTVATNTMLEGKGARVGLLTTEGFRDALEIRRGLREDQWNHRAPYAPVLVPRHLRLGVGGRIDKDGSEHAALVPGDIDRALETFRAAGVEAVAVAFFNSFLDDRHEAETEARIHTAWPEAWITRSAALTPMMGEYERTSTAVVNACLAPRIVDYLGDLDRQLRDLGLARPILLVQSNGGAISVDRVAARPVNLLLSGPAAAVGALDHYREMIDAGRTAGEDAGNLISMEIGGTSCDVMLMSGGSVAVKDDLMIAGYHVSTPSIDIHTIGAGGGTIAGVDAAGMLFVGPEGAGADPGPACYGLGGTQPTVTDAQMVLGRLRPGAYAGSGLLLNLDAARRAIETDVAEPLGLSVEDAAAGIIALVEQNLLHAVEYISIERGHAPRRFTMVAAGGAGPMHGTPVARGLGCGRVYVPRDAGALCALGMLRSDVRQDFQRYLRGDFDALDASEVDTEMAALDEQALAAMDEEGFAPEAVTLEHAMDLHYPGQLTSLRVTVGLDGFRPAQARLAFEAEYQRLYGHVQPDGRIVCAGLRVTARCPTGTPRTAWSASGVATEFGSGQTRRVWHDDGHGWLDTAVCDGTALIPGATLAGPAIVEERTATVLLGPGDRLRVDGAGNFMIDVAQAEQQASARPQATGSERDPVILALMQNRLDQISRHMGWVMTRTARSPIFSQSHDFSCFVTDPEGTLVANADGIPIHTGGGGFAVRALLHDFGGRIAPGDVFILSDPYVAGGNHLPDWVIARPIFVGDDQRLAGFCCNRAHQSDIGGGLAGTYNPEATEIWHEGIRLPVMKLVDRGDVRDDVWKLLLINSRTSDLLDGDLRAMLGSTQVGANRVAELAGELGLQSYFDHLAGVLDHADARMRAAIAKLPDGTYQGEDHTDNDCFEKVDVAVRVAMTVEGYNLTLDFSGSDPQMKGFKNSSLANTYSAAFLALSSFFDTDIPRNEGTYRCVTVIAPEGSIVNARAPAPMTMNTVFVAHEIVHAVWRALAQAWPERACAGWSKTTHNHITGRNPDGSSWVMYQWHAMGTPGATAERDGFAQMGHLISLGGLDLPNLEFHEQLFPLRYVRWEQRMDAAGPGARRGGTGVRYEADVLVPCTWSFRAEGLEAPSGYGVQGGGDGAVGEQRIQPCDGEEFVPPKYGVRQLGPARIVAETPGGGGWGDPFTRPAELVLRDVSDGVVSHEAAERDYGVALRNHQMVVDMDRTAAIRAGGRSGGRVTDFYLPLENDDRQIAAGLAANEYTQAHRIASMASIVDCSGYSVAVIEPGDRPIPAQLLSTSIADGLLRDAWRVDYIPGADLLRSHNFGTSTPKFEPELGRKWARAFDAVVIPGSLLQQRDGRHAYLAAANLLRAGGVLVAADLAARPKLWSEPGYTRLLPWLGDRRNSDCAALKALLKGGGFKKVSISVSRELANLVSSQNFRKDEDEITAVFNSAVTEKLLDCVFVKALVPNLPVEQRSIGEQNVIGQEAARRIFGDIGISPAEGVAFAAFFRVLNCCVDRALFASISPKMNKPEFEKISKAVDGLNSYAMLARELHDRHFPPTQISESLLNNILQWRSDAAAHYSLIQSGAQPNTWESDALAHLLGLFAATFDTEPTATVAGPAVRFIHAVYGAVGAFRRETGKAADQVRLGNASFGRALSLDTHKDMVAEGLRDRSFHLGGDDAMAFVMAAASANRPIRSPADSIRSTWKRARDEYREILKPSTFNLRHIRRP